MTPLFRWTGRYFGFQSGGYLFDARGFYRGWVTADGRVWRADGRYAGELIDRWYVRWCPTETRPADRTPLAPPDPPTVPTPWADRTPREPPAGYTDGLDAFGGD
jgi:hypothetical protein